MAGTPMRKSSFQALVFHPPSISKLSEAFSYALKFRTLIDHQMKCRSSEGLVLFFKVCHMNLRVFSLDNDGTRVS